MNNADTPETNLFHYARSEYWQDAFLCWMLAWADKRNEEKSKRLHKLGQDFLELLLCDHKDKNMPKPIKSVKIESQYHVGNKRRIDILATINSEYYLLIEDKTDSSEHSNQLKDYFKGVLKEKETTEEKVFPVYLKTGYIFTDEKASACNQGYKVVCLGDLQKLLEKHKEIKNDVFLQYKSHCENTGQHRKNMIDEVLGGKMPPAVRPESGYPAWDWDYTQWEFMLKLKAKLEQQGNNAWRNMREDFPEAGGEHFVQIDRTNRTLLQRGQNRGGSPWTQYWFTNYLFWRIDTDYPLRLRFGVWGKEMRKKIRAHDPWPKYREIFAQCLEDSPLQAGNDRTRSSANERTVGAIEPVDVNTLLEHLADIHNRFVKEIRGKWKK